MHSLKSIFFKKILRIFTFFFKKDLRSSILINNKQLMEQQKVVISPPSTSFAVLNLLSLALMYSKIEKGVYLKWWVVLSPTTLFLVYSLGKVLYFLARAQRSKALAVFSSSKLVMIWKFTQIIIISSLIAMNIFISEYL